MKNHGGKYVHLHNSKKINGLVKNIKYYSQKLLYINFTFLFLHSQVKM
jgi:hypothetical protein